MNLILVHREEIQRGDRVELSGPRAEHLLRVLRVERGARLRVGLVRGPRGEGEVLSIAPGRVVLGIELFETPPVRPPVDLILAIPRPKALSRTVRAAASCGVARIDLVNAWRVDKSYLDSPRLAEESLRRDLLLGCEQGESTWVPDCEVHRRLMPFLDREFRGCRLVAHPRAPDLIEEALAPGIRGELTVAVGPEGGWIERELASFAARGFSPVRLGPRVLRVESAVPALLAQIDLLRRLRA